MIESCICYEKGQMTPKVNQRSTGLGNKATFTSVSKIRPSPRFQQARLPLTRASGHLEFCGQTAWCIGFGSCLQNLGGGTYAWQSHMYGLQP